MLADSTNSLCGGEIEGGRWTRQSTFQAASGLVRISIAFTLIFLLWSPHAFGEEPAPPSKEAIAEEPAKESGKADGYQSEMRSVETNPPDPEWDLARSFPQPGSLIPQLKPQCWPTLKRRLYERHGLAVAASYQGIYQYATESLTGEHVAAAGWLLLEAKWEAYNRGTDFQGSFIVALDWRHAYGDAEPGLYHIQTGSQWATEAMYFEMGPYFPFFFWEQWLKRDRFVFRLGQINANSVLDFFRFKDARTQFSSSQFSFPAATIPLGPPAFGLNFKWWPIRCSELYVVGSVSDINGPIPNEGRYDWSGIFDTGEVMAGLEVGHNWKRSEGDFDHAHLDLWYASEASRKAFETDEGWGFKLSGSKQCGNWVGFGSYSYNTSRGGGFGLTNAEQAANAGLAYLNPLGVKGEAAISFSWGRPLTAADPFRRVASTRDQWGTEAYWKILLTPDLWLTPGVQVIRSPSFNPGADWIVIPQLKFRVFF